jgi:hypothetical protein
MTDPGSIIPISDEQAKALQEALKTLQGFAGFLKETFGTVPAPLPLCSAYTHRVTSRVSRGSRDSRAGIVATISAQQLSLGGGDELIL